MASSQPKWPSPLCPVLDAEVVEEDKTVDSVNEEAGYLGSENIDSTLEDPQWYWEGKDPPTPKPYFLSRTGKNTKKETTYTEDDNKEGVGGAINKTNGSNERSPTPSFWTVLWSTYIRTVRRKRSK